MNLKVKVLLLFIVVALTVSQEANAYINPCGATYFLNIVVNFFMGIIIFFRNIINGFKNCLKKNTKEEQNNISPKNAKQE